jgi:uncharacterized protein (TIGR03066 family)
MVTRRSLVLCVLLLFVGAAVAYADADLKTKIIGKWQPAEEKSVTIEFMAGGKLSVTIVTDNKDKSAKPMVITGTYKWIDKETLEVSVAEGKDAKAEQVKVAIDGDTLTTTDSKKKTEKLVRVK